MLLHRLFSCCHCVNVLGIHSANNQYCSINCVFSHTLLLTRSNYSLCAVIHPVAPWSVCPWQSCVELTTPCPPANSIQQNSKGYTKQSSLSSQPELHFFSSSGSQNPIWQPPFYIVIAELWIASEDELN